MPECLFEAHLAGEKCLDLAEETLRFLIAVEFDNDLYSPVRSDGWYRRNHAKARFDERVMTNVPGVEGFHALRIRRSGPFLFAEAHLEVDKMLTVERAHQIAEEVEDTVKKRFEKIDTISIHIGVAHRS